MKLALRSFFVAAFVFLQTSLGWAQYGESSVRFRQVSEREGGVLLSIPLRYGFPLDHIRLNVSKAAIKTYEVYLVTQNQRRILVPSLSQMAPFYYSKTSQYLRNGELIASVHVRAESVDGLADLEVVLTSNDGPPPLR